MKGRRHNPQTRSYYRRKQKMFDDKRCLWCGKDNPNIPEGAREGRLRFTLRLCDSCADVNRERARVWEKKDYERRRKS